jgi:hypothetical protein
VSEELLQVSPAERADKLLRLIRLFYFYLIAEFVRSARFLAASSRICHESRGNLAASSIICPQIMSLYWVFLPQPWIAAGMGLPLFGFFALFLRSQRFFHYVSVPFFLLLCFLKT